MTEMDGEWRRGVAVGLLASAGEWWRIIQKSLLFTPSFLSAWNRHKEAWAIARARDWSEPVGKRNTRSSRASQRHDDYLAWREEQPKIEEANNLKIEVA